MQIVVMIQNGDEQKNSINCSLQSERIHSHRLWFNWIVMTHLWNIEELWNQFKWWNVYVIKWINHNSRSKDQHLHNENAQIRERKNASVLNRINITQPSVCYTLNNIRKPIVTLSSAIPAFAQCHNRSETEYKQKICVTLAHRNRPYYPVARSVQPASHLPKKPSPSLNVIYHTSTSLTYVRVCVSTWITLQTLVSSPPPRLQLTLGIQMCLWQCIRKHRLALLASIERRLISSIIRVFLRFCYHVFSVYFYPSFFASRNFDLHYRHCFKINWLNL